jgi:hypothetical protein
LKAKGDVLAFLDDDVETGDNWLAALAEVFWDQTVQLCGGKNVPVYESPPPEWMQDFWFVFRPSLSGSDAGRWLEIPAWMFDRSACARLRVATDAHADLAALTTLATLLRRRRIERRRVSVVGWRAWRRNPRWR